MVGNIEQRVLDIDKKVSLTYKDYSRADVGNAESATIFLSGWSMKGNSRSLRYIGRELQKMRPSEKVMTLACKSLSKSERIRHEASAISEFLLDKGIKELTLIGYSEGATKAISTAGLLVSKNPEINLKGLILSSPLGVSQTQNITPRLIHAMAFAIPFDTITQIKHNPKDWKVFFYAFCAGIAVISGIMGEILKQNIQYLPNLKKDIDEISRRNNDIEKISSPIVIVTGTRDNVVKKEEIRGDINEAIKNGLPVFVLNSEKFSNHGLPFLRPKTFVRASLGMLDRARRSYVT